jgi:hypothetical protein
MAWVHIIPIVWRFYFLFPNYRYIDKRDTQDSSEQIDIDNSLLFIHYHHSFPSGETFRAVRVEIIRKNRFC